MRKEEPALRVRIRELAYRWRRYGYRRIHVLLRREGRTVNHKRVYRIYREEGLIVRKRKRKHVAVWRGEKPQAPTHPNARWSMDFVADATAQGHRLRTLNVVDDFTRESLAIEVDTSLPGGRVIRVLDRLAQERGLPEEILTDNGPEFIGRALDEWAYRHGVRQRFIEPGKPIQNAFVESFNGKFRDECLNEHWFLDVADARGIIERWRRCYNEERPHSALGNATPAEFAARVSGLRSPSAPSDRTLESSGDCVVTGLS